LRTLSLGMHNLFSRLSTQCQVPWGMNTISPGLCVTQRQTDRQTRAHTHAQTHTCYPRVRVVFIHGNSIQKEEWRYGLIKKKNPTPPSPTRNPPAQSTRRADQAKNDFDRTQTLPGSSSFPRLPVPPP
jgi:hypothetical protein